MNQKVSVQLGHTAGSVFAAFIKLLAAVLPTPAKGIHVLRASNGYWQNPDVWDLLGQFRSALGQQVKIEFANEAGSVVGHNSEVRATLSGSSGRWIVTLSGPEDAIIKVASEAGLADVWEVADPTPRNVTIGEAIERAKLAVACAD